MFLGYAPVVFGGGLAILGILVLMCMPGAPVTATNVVIFVCGGFAGIVVFGNLAHWMYEQLPVGMGAYDLRGVGNPLGYVVVFIEATAGGAGLVWLKLRRERQRG